MTVKDLIKRLSTYDPNKIVVYAGKDSGWSNIVIIEEEHNVRIYQDDTPLFSSE